jgi:predicted RNase H-like nuclease (RuvC/YqgF family)
MQYSDGTFSSFTYYISLDEFRLEKAEGQLEKQRRKAMELKDEVAKVHLEKEKLAKSLSSLEQKVSCTVKAPKFEFDTLLR